MANASTDPSANAPRCPCPDCFLLETHGECHECGLPATHTVSVDGTDVPSCDDHDEIVARVARLQFAANPTATRDWKDDMRDILAFEAATLPQHTIRPTPWACWLPDERDPSIYRCTFELDGVVFIARANWGWPMRISARVPGAPAHHVSDCVSWPNWNDWDQAQTDAQTWLTSRRAT